MKSVGIKKLNVEKDFEQQEKDMRSGVSENLGTWESLWARPKLPSTARICVVPHGIQVG